MRKSILYFISILLFAIFFSFCQKDPDTKLEKITIYLLLCPNGTDACYNDCANSTGLSDGNVTGTDFNNFSTCKSQCDAYCNLSFLFIEN